MVGSEPTGTFMVKEHDESQLMFEISLSRVAAQIPRHLRLSFSPGKGMMHHIDVYAIRLRGRR